jgi:hypothetical protein
MGDEKGVNMVASPRDPQEEEKWKAEYCVGKRIGFTVIYEAKDSTGKPYEGRYDADRLESVFRDGDMEPMLSFVSSGRRVQVEASRVLAIEFSKPKVWYHGGAKMWHGTGHCATCDGPLNHLVKRPS